MKILIVDDEANAHYGMARAIAGEGRELFEAEDGESGTGKELVARELHRCSARSVGPFIAVNTAAHFFLTRLAICRLPFRRDYCEFREALPTGSVLSTSRHRAIHSSVTTTARGRCAFGWALFRQRTSLYTAGNDCTFAAYLAR